MSKISMITLKKEQDGEKELEKSFVTNPVKKVIQELFHNELSGSSYRKLTLSAMKDIILNKLKEATISPGPYSSAVANLSFKIKKTKTYEEALTALNEYLFS